MAASEAEIVTFTLSARENVSNHELLQFLLL